MIFKIITFIPAVKFDIQAKFLRSVLSSTYNQNARLDPVPNERAICLPWKIWGRQQQYPIISTYTELEGRAEIIIKINGEVFLFNHAVP